jgi:2-methylcitrate dehydratase
MTEQIHHLAQFVARASLADLSQAAIRELKLRILDSIGCALGAIGAEPMGMLREQLADFGGNRWCTLIGGQKTAPDRAAFYNAALVRYLDFNDSYLAKGETCHPSDNLAGLLAAAEYAGTDGRDLLAALAAAYQVHCRLSDEAPVRHRGFDHTTQGAYAAAAGVARALGLDAEKTAHALAISGTAYNALRVTRTGKLSHWKGLAYPNTVLGATHAAFLAMRGITGPLEVFEGNKGFKETIAGEFDIDWATEDLNRVTRTIIKKFNAEIHSQSTVEGVLELKVRHGIDPEQIREIKIDIFDVAYHIIGGGQEGDKTRVATKEEADHSLHYIVAAALLDDRVMPEQYRPDRIGRQDVQQLLRKIKVLAADELSRRFPDQMPCRIEIATASGERYSAEKADYEGFHSRPMNWETVQQKFETLATGVADKALCREIVSAVAEIERIRVSELTSLLGRVGP